MMIARMRSKSDIRPLLIFVLFINFMGACCKFATNFKCNESKQSPKYLSDMKTYVNEISQYENQWLANSIDLSTLGLGFLQDDDFVDSDSVSYSHIISLNLSENVIKSISFGLLLRYPSLQDLNLSKNCLTHLEEKHRILFKGLHSLNVSQNLITSIHPFVFSNLSLDVVDLSYNNLLKFLAADFEIKQLHINDNRLTQIEIDSRHHRELHLLDASNNNLKIFQINTDFNSLILSNNQLTMDEYFSIRNIYGTLDMSRNRINELNWKFISCVKNLDISYNHITFFQIGCSLKRFQQLERLNLDGNFLCSLNEVVNMTKCFPNLKFVTAMYNPLNKAQKIHIKRVLKKMKVKSQIFDYDTLPMMTCYDIDCIAFNLFFKKKFNHKLHDDHIM